MTTIFVITPEDQSCHPSIFHTDSDAIPSEIRNCIECIGANSFIESDAKFQVAMGCLIWYLGTLGCGPSLMPNFDKHVDSIYTYKYLDYAVLSDDKKMFEISLAKEGLVYSAEISVDSYLHFMPPDMA